MRQLADDDGQLVLFPDEELRLPVETTSPRARLPPPASPPTPSEQLALFGEVPLLRAAIERALAEADFHEAQRRRDELLATYGANELPPDLDFLDDLAGACREPLDLDRALAGWRGACAATPTRTRRVQVRDALFLRLARSFAPAEVAVADDACVPDLVNALLRGGHAEVARSVVRDALLRGVELPPRSIEDAEIRDVLAEDVTAPWHAIVGVLKGAWWLPRDDASGVEALVAGLTGPVPEADAERAAAFWTCLLVAALPPQRAGELRLLARARMRLLDPELHAVYMRRFG
jgi:hypothetical protein